MAAWLVFTTAPNRRVAGRLAKALVQGKLAACVTQTHGGESVYRWKGKLERSKESFLTIKTSGAKVKKVLQFIRSSHPYELPEAIAVKIDKASTKYLKWIEESTGVRH